jgi:hypothetical protein
MAAFKGQGCARVLGGGRGLSVPAARGVVLLCTAGRDGPRSLTVMPWPLAQVRFPGALAAGGGTPGPVRLCPPGRAGVLDEGGELRAERGGVLAVQVLISRVGEGEPHRLLRWAAG